MILSFLTTFTSISTYHTKDFNAPKAHVQTAAPERDERLLKVRKITDQTPLPPRRADRKEGAMVDRRSAKDTAYFENRKLEEQFHKPPEISGRPTHDSRKEKQESPLKNIVTLTFDDKPALSLKDALAKAIHDHQTELSEEKKEKPELIELPVSTKPKRDNEDERGRRKEVSEDILRELLED